MQSKFLFCLFVGFTAVFATRGHRLPNRHRNLHRNHGKHNKNLIPSESAKSTEVPHMFLIKRTPNDGEDDASLSPKYDESINTNHDTENSYKSLDFEPSGDDESIKFVAANCPKCKQNSVKISENELANLRIEYVKNQILHKLRLDKRPPKSSKSFQNSLPEPVLNAIQNELENTENFNRDDYFAKTTQKIIFLTRGRIIELFSN
jgi:hypothetical protein